MGFEKHGSIEQFNVRLFPSLVMNEVMPTRHTGYSRWLLHEEGFEDLSLVDQGPMKTEYFLVHVVFRFPGVGGRGRGGACLG